MLTLKSNFNNFKDLQGTLLTDAILKQLYNNIIIKDFINLNGNISKGYPSEIADLILNKIDATDKSAKIIVINDLGFQMYNALTDAGIFKTNILLAFGKWTKDGKISDDKKVYNIMKAYAKSNFIEFENDLSNIITLEEFFSMEVKFDYIIANPPYKIGNEITKAVIDNVDFDQYINLMPASKYKKGELFKKVSAVEQCKDTFDDAAVGDSLTIAKICKDRGSYDTYEDFSNNFRDPRFVEFYKLNARCKETFNYSHAAKRDELPDVAVSFMLTMRTVLDGTHQVKGKGAADIPYNMDNNADDIPWDITHDCASCNFIIFDSSIKKINMCKFWYHNSLQNDLIKGLNMSSGRCTIAIPNIDWSKDRDYEHLTLDDIMKILKEENPNVN